MNEPCLCNAYPFPHREASGKCEAPSTICSDCKSPAEGKWEDFGIGPYEYWGDCGTDVQMCFVSECCEAPVCRADNLSEIVESNEQQ